MPTGFFWLHLVGWPWSLTHTNAHGTGRSGWWRLAIFGDGTQLGRHSTLRKTKSAEENQTNRSAQTGPSLKYGVPRPRLRFCSKKRKTRSDRLDETRETWENLSVKREGGDEQTKRFHSRLHNGVVSTTSITEIDAASTPTNSHQINAPPIERFKITRNPMKLGKAR